MEVSFLEQAEPPGRWKEAPWGRERKLPLFPDPSLEYRILGGVSRNACLCIFHLQKCLWAFGQYLRFRMFCLGLKSLRGGGWGVASCLTACSWRMQFCEVGFSSLRIGWTLCSSPMVQSISGSVPGMEGSVIEHKGWLDWFEPFGSSVN